MDFRKTKIVGRRKPPGTPEERLALADRLFREAVKLSPWPRPRGFVFKARTWEDYEAWKKAQENPWLW